MVPQAGGIQSILGYTPNLGDSVLLFDQSTGGYDSYEYSTYSLGGHPPHWATGWHNGGIPEEPVINVGESFWIEPTNSTVWDRYFIPNPCPNN